MEPDRTEGRAHDALAARPAGEPRTVSDAGAPARGSSLALELLGLVLLAVMLVAPSAIPIPLLAVVGHVVGYPLAALVAAKLQKRPPVAIRGIGVPECVVALLLLNAFLCWIPAALVLAAFLLAGWASIRRGSLRRFVLVVVAAAGATLASGLPAGAPLWWFHFGLALVSVSACFGPYFALAPAVAAHRARPTRALMLGAFILLGPTIRFYGQGASTPWLTPLVARQPGFALLVAPSLRTLGTRGVAPIPGGLLIQENGAHLRVLRDGVLRECFGRHAHFGRVDQPVCDPEDRFTCYVPMDDGGLLTVNTLDCRVTRLPITSLAYDLLEADPSHRHFALVNGRDHVVTLLERLAPGRFRHVADLAMETLIGKKLPSSRSITLTEDAMLYAAPTANRQIEVWSYDFGDGELERILATRPGTTAIGGSWHGLAVPGERIIHTNVLGLVQVYDWNGELSRQVRLAPLLRQVVYDPERRLAYVLDDFGFLWVVDPRSGTRRQPFFVGLKPKNMTFEDGVLHLGSSAGIFAIRLDEALAGRDPATP